MKRETITIISLIVVLALLFVFQACKNPLVPQNPVNPSVQADNVAGSLLVSFSSNSPRTIYPAIDMEMASFDISGTGPNSASFSVKDIFGVAYTAEKIVTGYWTIIINAKNSFGILVMTGSLDVEIVSGENVISIDIYPLTSDGTIDTVITWPSGILSTINTTIVSTLTSSLGSSIPLNFTTSDGSASCTQNIPAGYYLWDIQLEESGQILFRKAPEVVRIVAEKITESVINLSSSLHISPTMEEDITGSAPLLLEWFDYPEAVSYEIQISDDSTFTSITPKPIDSIKYQIESSLVASMYYWRVRPVYDGSITGEWGATWSFTLLNDSIGIGDFYAGGTVFYFDGKGGGLVCSESDLPGEGDEVPWGGEGTPIGSTSVTIGTGATNTTAIVAIYGTNEPYNNRSDYAAKLCSDLVLNDYYDWFLPSLDELTLIGTNLYTQGLGGVNLGGTYWSSSEYSSDKSVAKQLGSAWVEHGWKSQTYQVRAVRVF